ncbi:MAG: Spi family protease inhibitor [Dyadobacter fermentans]
MKKKFALLTFSVFAIAFCLVQCKQDGHDSWPASRKSMKSLAVDASRATEIASSYSDFTRDVEIARKNLRTNATSAGQPRKVSNVRTLKDSEGADLMHIIEYRGENNEQRGFVIVAADRRVTPILAKGDSGSLNLDNPGVQIWISHVMDQISQGKRDVKQPEKDIEALWRDFEKRADIKAGRINGSADPQLPPGRNCPDDWDAFVPPILQTSWGQGLGYNRYCPSRSCATAVNCNNAPAGCGAVAIAQVWNANTLQKPTHYTVPPAGPQPVTYPLPNLTSNTCNTNDPEDMMIASLIRVAGMWAGSDYNFLAAIR